MGNVAARTADRTPSDAPACRIAVVGPCASGKSTLVTALRARGYDAYAPAQEHSAIAELWRHAAPDVVIALLADIAAVRRRRGAQWPAWLHELQLRRLARAYAAADLTIDTSALSPSELVAGAEAQLAERCSGPAARSGRSRRRPP